jgi:hypothetical protein
MTTSADPDWSAVLAQLGRFQENRRSARERVAQARSVRAALKLTREASRQTRSRCTQTRLQRPGPRCPICLWPFPVDRAGYAAAYVPEGHWAASETALVHQRCFGAWLAERMSPVPPGVAAP